ncbi:helicase-related protein, partial [Pseudomonas sp. MD330_11]|uniref:helicase-related protein n=1 Tax=Pseudomonas sp. MD330_11 TaxID=3241255 RepID=UPI0036D20D54
MTPAREKEIYLVYLLNQRAGQTGVLYTSTTRTAQTVAKVLQYLGFSAIPIHRQLPDSARLAALNEFRAGSWDLL